MSIRQYAFIGLLIFICFPVAVFVLSALLMEQADANTAAPKIEGIFWQVDQMSQPSGNWQLLGVDTLVNQWSIVDGRSFLMKFRCSHGMCNPIGNILANSLGQNM